MDLNQLIDSLQASDTSLEDTLAGFGRVRPTRESAAYTQKLLGAAKFLKECKTGKRPAHHLKEALTRSDFPILMGGIYDRAMLGVYEEYPAVYQNYCRIGYVDDFREKELYYLDGLEAALSSAEEVKERARGKEKGLTEGKYTTSVKAYERKVDLTFEMLMNDRFGTFDSVPARLARAARRTEQKLATQLFFDANGPHASFFTVGNKNKITGNPVLSIAGLQAGYIQLGAMTDAEGEPIVVEAVELVVPPALEVTALNILNAIELRQAEAGGTSNQILKAENWMKNRTRLSVDPYIPFVASTANGSTSWALFASVKSGRPAGEITFLNGHEKPGIYRKRADTETLGGELVPELGDFETRSQRTKLLHIVGGTRLSPKAAVASNGSGS